MSAAHELSRLRYLQAMGVQVYVSRRALEGAAPTQKLCFKSAQPAVEQGLAVQMPGPPGDKPVVATASPGSAAVTQKPATGSLAPEHLRASLRGVQTDSPGAARTAQGVDPLPADTRDTPAPSTSTPSTNTPSTTTPSTTTPSTTTPSTTTTAASTAASSERFRLALVVFAQRLWLEDLGDQALATDQLKLVAAIGRALAHPEVDHSAPRVAQFDWPLHDNQQLGLGADEASASLEGYLRRQLDDHQCVELICLGDAAAQRVRSLQLPCAKREIRSSKEMLDEPQLKRDVWRELRS